MKSRQDTVRYLKIIVWVLWGTSLFNFIYSTMVMTRWTKNCTPKSNLTVAWNLYDLSDRLDSYILWFYPLIYLFWPSKRHQNKERRFIKVVENINETLSFRSSSHTSSLHYRTSVNDASDSSDDEYDY